MLSFIFLLSALTHFLLDVDALYGGGDDVVELTTSNFNKKVINDDGIWIVEFFAPWCGHCQSLVPEYKKVAKALKGFVKVGAVDMTQHESLGAPYGIRGFPTIKIFGTSKQSPADFGGQRTAKALADAAIAELRKIVDVRLGGRQRSSSGSGAPGGDDVIDLTDSNFEEQVLKSKDLWLVEFFAPWCGHCKNLEPHWKAAASQLKGKFKLGALDATVHTMMANRFNIRGFPTIKFFGPGANSVDDAIDYDGGRTSADIVAWAEQKVSENVPPPELVQITSPESYVEGCPSGQQLCILAFLPHILDCQADCRNGYLGMARELTEKFRKNAWGWIWAQAGDQPALEQAFGVGGFGYPALVAFNARKQKYSTLTGSFSRDGIAEFLRDLSYGKGKTSSMAPGTGGVGDQGGLQSVIQTVDLWDGREGVPPLDDVDLDDLFSEEDDDSGNEGKEDEKQSGEVEEEEDRKVKKKKVEKTEL